MMRADKETVVLEGEPGRQLVTLVDIQDAHRRIAPYVHRTPLLTCATLDKLATAAVQGRLRSSAHVNVRLAFKSEHLQRVGAFKMRGATNAVQTHLERMRKSDPSFQPANLWVVTHSSGNHAAAVACAARSVGACAAVVMPRTAPAVKKAAVAGYGARIIECEPTQDARESTAVKLIQTLREEDENRTVQFIHPYDESLVIAGQGTLALEMLEQARALGQGKRRCSEAQTATSERQDETTWSLSEQSNDEQPPLDIVVAPVGGGGMLSGVSTATRSKYPQIVVLAAEPELADDAARSFQTGNLKPAVSPPQTICDGLVTSLSPFTLQHIQKYVGNIITVTEEQIVHALRLMWTRAKQIIEPSAAVGLAVVLNSTSFAEEVEKAMERRLGNRKLLTDDHVEVRIGIVLTGGNVELDSVMKIFSQYPVE